MADPFQHKRGTTSKNNHYIGAAGELTVDTDKNTVVVHDGATSGGYPLALEGQATGGGGLQTVDSIEDQEIGEYAGDTGQYGINSTTTYDGSYALENTGGLTGTITSTSGLNYYPQPGDRFAWRAQLGSGFAGALFGVQSEVGDANVSGYLVHANSTNFNLQRADSGSYTKLDEATSLSIPTAEWVQFEVIWGDDGSITARIYDASGSELAEVSGSDTNYTSGGIGWRSNESGELLDYYHSGYATAPGTGSSGTTGPIDDFEDQDIAEYAGDTTAYSVTTAAAKSGSYGLECSNNDASIASTTGLNRYPQQDETVRIWYQVGTVSGVSDSIGFAAQSESSFPDGYYFYHDGNAGYIQFFVRSGGSNTFLGTATSVGLAANTWYEIEIQWASDGSLTGTVYDDTGTEVAQTTASDTTYSSGGIAYRIRDQDGANKTTYLDNYRVL